MLHATRWLHKLDWNCRKRTKLSSVAAKTCQEYLVLCRSYCRAWLWSLKVTKQAAGTNRRHGKLNCGFFKAFCTCFFNFFFPMLLVLVLFSPSLDSIKSFGSLFLLVFENLLPVVYTQKHCAVYGSLVHIRNFTHSCSITVNEVTIAFSEPVSASKRNSWAIRPKALFAFTSASENTP